MNPLNFHLMRERCYFRGTYKLHRENLKHKNIEIGGIIEMKLLIINCHMLHHRNKAMDLRNRTEQSVCLHCWLY